MPAQAPELVWKFAGQPRPKRTGKAPYPCEACNDVTLNVWKRVGIKRISFYRCWNHGPGQDGRECDGPEQVRG